ncbi:hypothetical protein RF11_12302 [Thelohanellus kitauei]|uniref:Cystatin domain-containing protein n=1 Tax=Thelohanellus kitauei TaxID=669202 RepID=A0A0C2J524_THEKT|nr:hypothetical protein RF11_12302 [Thelohanellus kitauei]
MNLVFLIVVFVTVHGHRLKDKDGRYRSTEIQHPKTNGNRLQPTSERRHQPANASLRLSATEIRHKSAKERSHNPVYEIGNQPTQEEGSYHTPSIYTMPNQNDGNHQPIGGGTKSKAIFHSQYRSPSVYDISLYNEVVEHIHANDESLRHDYRYIYLLDYNQDITVKSKIVSGLYYTFKINTGNTFTPTLYMDVNLSPPPEESFYLYKLDPNES